MRSSCVAPRFKSRVSYDTIPKFGVRNLSIAFAILLLLTALFPVLTISDGFATQSLSATLAALVMAAAGIAARAADVQFAAHVTRRLVLAAAIPAVWMIVQLLPMPFPALSHTVWINGNEALDQQAFGHITVDLGKTIEALAFYLANIVLILACILLSRDYQRASRLFIVLAAITILTVLALLADQAFHFFASTAQQNLGAASALGLVLSLAIGALGLDRRRALAKKSARDFLFASGSGMLICAAGLAAAANMNITVVAAFGAATFLSIQLARGLQLTSWTLAILLATLLAAATMIVVWRFDSDIPLSPLLRFSTSTPTNSLLVAQRLLSDTGWVGAGAGTYAALLPIYQDLGNATVQLPTTMADFAVGLGLPMAIVSVGIGLWLIIRLYGGALARGRNWFYAAAAASGAVVLIGEAFCDASLLQAGIAATGDVLVGIGLAQSVSRVDMA